MFEFLKILHLLSLFAGGAAALGGWVLMRRVAASGRPPDPVVREAMAALGNMGVGAIALLWLTGLPMAVLSGAFVSAGWAFTAKLLAAAAVLILSPAMLVLRRQAVAAGRAPDMALIGRLAALARVAVVAAVILAVIAFA